MQAAGKCNIVDVVPSLLGERAALTPTSHPRVNQSRVERERFIRTELQPLHDAWPVPFEQNIGLADQLPRERQAIDGFDIECN